MTETAPGVWDGTHPGQTFRISLDRGPSWGAVKRPRTYTVGTCGKTFTFILSLGDAERIAVDTIVSLLVWRREKAARRWYKDRFHETSAAATASYEDRVERSFQLEQIGAKPDTPESERTSARTTYRLIGSLQWPYWWNQEVAEPIEETVAAPPDKLAERIAKIKALRDHPRTSPAMVEAAEAALKRIRDDLKPLEGTHPTDVGHNAWDDASR